MDPPFPDTYRCIRERGIHRIGDHRDVKLLEHAMKVVERVIEKRIREQVKIDDMQFGFRAGRGMQLGMLFSM